MSPSLTEGTRWLVAREAEAPSGESEVVASHRDKRVHRAKLEESSAGPAQLKGPVPLTPATLKGMSGILNDHVPFPGRCCEHLMIQGWIFAHGTCSRNGDSEF